METSVFERYDANASTVAIFANSDGCPPMPPTPNQLFDPFTVLPTTRTIARIASVEK
jgi:hypothetical protein